MVTWDEWRAGATHIEVGELDIATYDLGPEDAPTYTFCHGYPSASLDIAEVATRLHGLRLLALDLPGFGASDKPPADETARAGTPTPSTPRPTRWRACGGRASRHHAAGGPRLRRVGGPGAARPPVRRVARRGTELTGVVWMNGGIYPDLHRPTVGQQMLLDPDSGAEWPRLSTRRCSPAACGSPGAARPMDEALVHEMWRSMDDGGGCPHARPAALRGRPAGARRPVAGGPGGRRPAHGVRLGGARPGLRRPHDPAAGRAHPPGPRGRLADVGHWPPLEAPDEVAAAIAGLS